MSASPGASPLHHAAHGPPPRSGEEFGEAAARLAGVAGVMFGWRPDVFWNATPAELAALVRAVSGDAAWPLAGVDVARLKEMLPDG